MNVIHRLFPNAIDRLPDEFSRENRVEDGTPSIFVGCADDFEGLAFAFGPEQCVLARDTATQHKLEKYQPDAMVMTIEECKGLEYDDIILVNFFSDSKSPWHLLDPTKRCSNSAHKDGLLLELQLLYVAVTRACKRLVFVERLERIKSTIGHLRNQLPPGAVEWTPKAENNTVSEVLALRLYRPSGKDDWLRSGHKYFQLQRFKTACICFRNAEEDIWAKRSQAHLLISNVHVQSASRARSDRLKAAEMFMSIKDDQQAFDIMQNNHAGLDRGILCKFGHRFAEQHSAHYAAKCFEWSHMFLEAAEQYGIASNHENEGRMLWAARRFTQALTIWLKADITITPERLQGPGDMRRSQRKELAQCMLDYAREAANDDPRRMGMFELSISQFKRGGDKKMAVAVAREAQLYAIVVDLLWDNKQYTEALLSCLIHPGGVVLEKVLVRVAALGKGKERTVLRELMCKIVQDEIGDQHYTFDCAGLLKYMYDCNKDGSVTSEQLRQLRRRCSDMSVLARWFKRREMNFSALHVKASAMVADARRLWAWGLTPLRNQLEPLGEEQTQTCETAIQLRIWLHHHHRQHTSHAQDVISRLLKYFGTATLPSWLSPLRRTTDETYQLWSKCVQQMLSSKKKAIDAAETSIDTLLMWGRVELYDYLMRDVVTSCRDCDDSYFQRVTDLLAMDKQ